MTPPLDRSQAPPLAGLQAPPVPAYQRHVLANGLPVYLVPFGSQPVAEVQLVLEGGQWVQPVGGVANLTARMLQEGTHGYSAVELAQAFDRLGATVNLRASNHHTTLGVGLLSRHLPEGLALLQELVVRPSFPAERFTQLKTQTLQQLRIQQQRTQYHAQRGFFQGLFPSHPYGKVESAEAIEALGPDDLRQYWERHLRPLSGYVVVAGAFDPEPTLRALEAQLGVLQPTPAPDLPTATLAPANQGHTHVAVPEAVQTTLHLGHPAPPRSHPDYHRLRFLGVVLGGYFGSRLMATLREELGYTYGIGAGFTALRHAGYLAIRTDVANAYAEPALAAIRTEVERLRQAPIPPEELERARNAYLGRVIAGRETPFQIADLLISYLQHDLPLSTLGQGFAQVQAVTAEELLALAQQHLMPEAIWVVSAGG